MALTGISSARPVGVSFANADNLERPRDPSNGQRSRTGSPASNHCSPPLPTRLIGCPPNVPLPATDPTPGDGEAECVVPTLRICARTCDNCRSYSHATCCRRKGRVTSNSSALGSVRHAIRCTSLSNVHCFPCPVSATINPKREFRPYNRCHPPLLGGKESPKGPGLWPHSNSPREISTGQVPCRKRHTGGGSMKSPRGNGSRTKTV